MIIRKTESVCPVCLIDLPADIVEMNGHIYMKKSCPEHGLFNVLLSRHPWYYKGLNDLYFSLITTSLPQREYIVSLTRSCNLNCPICLASANMGLISDYTTEKIKEFLKGKKNYKLDLMGAEPTMREDLFEIIRLINRSGNRVSLHTNGIKLANYDYVTGLKKAGLREVHLQFDGFSDDIYKVLRNAPLLDIKMKALENLEKVGLFVDLKATIAKGVNEGEMIKILDFASRHSFIKEVNFLGCRHIGRARNLPIDICILPDEMIDVVVHDSGGKISRKGIYHFQRLYFSLLRLLSVRKCFNMQYYLICRKNGNWFPVEDYIDLEKIDRSIESFKNFYLERNLSNGVKLLTSAFYSALQPRGIAFLLKDLLITKIRLLPRFQLKGFPENLILVGFITACDSYIMDYQVSLNCGKGELAPDVDVTDSGAYVNIARDRYKQRLDAPKNVLHIPGDEYPM